MSNVLNFYTWYSDPIKTQLNQTLDTFNTFAADMNRVTRIGFKTLCNNII